MLTSRVALPGVSVVIPTYNRGKYLARAIRSVLEQFQPGDELIVVDDGSTDDTPEVLATFGPAIVVLNGGHSGAGHARNLGIARARNELVAFLDSDDIWLPRKLDLQRHLMAARPDLLYSFGNFQVMFADDSVINNFLYRWSRDPASLPDALGTGAPYSESAPLPSGCTDFTLYEGDFYSLQLTGFYILTDTLVVRRSAAGEALKFAEDLPTYEDLECFYGLARRGRGALLDVELARQFDHGEGRLSDLSPVVKLDARLVLMKRYWGSDAVYRRAHDERYRAALDSLLCRKAGHLITRGGNVEAREALREAFDPPLGLRVLASMPPAVTLAGLGLVRKVRMLGRRAAKP